MGSSNFFKNIIVLLVLILVLIAAAFSSVPDESLHIIACDVGQGDAILIVKGGSQILIDGGPDNSVLSCLGRHLPFWDRTIELVILTHPQSDHYTGLIEIVRRYDVDLFLRNEVQTSSQGYQVLEREVGGRGIRTLKPSIGQKLRLGLMYLDVLWPNECKNTNTNNCAVALKLNYGSFKAIFTGDLEEGVKEELIATGLLEDIDYIKVSHHGSKNGVTNFILEILRPEVAVISAGKNNRYDHPNIETLETLKKHNAKIFRTDELGDVEIVSNGKVYWTK